MTRDEIVGLVALHIASKQGHAGYFVDGKFVPGPNTMRMAEDEVSALEQAAVDEDRRHNYEVGS